MNVSPIILEIDYLPEMDYFRVIATVDGVSQKELLAPAAFAFVCTRIDKGFCVGGINFVFSKFDRTDVGPRARRSVIQYFRAALAARQK